MYQVFNANGELLSKGDSIGRKVEGGGEWFFIDCDKPWRIWAHCEVDGESHSFTVDGTKNVFNLTIR